MAIAVSKSRSVRAAFKSGVYPTAAGVRETLLRIEVEVTDEEGLERAFSMVRHHGFVPISRAPSAGSFPQVITIALPASAFDAFVQELSLRARILLRG